MSFWVNLLDKNGQSVDVPNQSEGGTYVVGGTDKAELNVTYNYSSFYYKELSPEDGLRWLDGRLAKDTIRSLEDAIGALGTEVSDDYWESAPGNAGHALSILLLWARMYPDAVFEVD